MDVIQDRTEVVARIMMVLYMFLYDAVWYLGGFAGDVGNMITPRLCSL